MIRVAVIGAGVMGTVHARGLRTFGERVAVTRVFDTDADRAAALAADVGAQPVADLEAAVCAADVDAVAICVPPKLNRSIAALAFDHGKHVFVEKPIATTLDDADAIIDCARRSGRVLMVGLVLRFWPGYPELHDRVASGELGSVSAVTCQRLQPPPALTGWLADVDATGGIAPLVLVHDFDLMNSYLGQPRTVAAAPLRGEGVAAPHVVAVVEFDAGTGFVEGSVAMPRSHGFSTSIHVYGDRGSAVYGYAIAPSGDGAADGSGRDASQFTPSQAPAITVYHDGPRGVETIPLTESDPWRPELAHFVEAVAGEHAVERGTPEQARTALSMALAANASLETGRPASVAH